MANLKKNSHKDKIIMFGFDELGFDIQQDICTYDNYSMEFMSLKQNGPFDNVEGVIIPQGIFEKIEYFGTYSGRVGRVQIAENPMIERLNQIFNLLKDGKWICFLVQQIIDSIPVDYVQSRDIRDTDLCKRVLNKMDIRSRPIDAQISLSVMHNEFAAYIREFGVAKTAFECYQSDEIQLKPISKSLDLIVGFECFNKLFMLPFHTTRKDRKTLLSIATIVSNAIIDYRQKNIRYLPSWLNGLKFTEEEKLEGAITSLDEKIIKLKDELQNWKNYKSILTTSGNILKETIIEILEKFFDVRIDPTDENREDIKILDENKNILAVLEVKGTKSGIKREHINQVDSHRERNSLSATVPGILIINNEMDRECIAERQETIVANEQIKHAKNLNVLIVRTIDLLYLMKILEKNNMKREILMKIITSGGGWLKSAPEKYEIIEK